MTEIPFTVTMVSMWRRRKPLDDVPISGPLHRSLETVDLTFLGLSAMTGSATYVVCIVGAKDYAGPSLVLSFILAAVFSIMAASSYMEFASQIQRNGGIYQYVYVTLGEVMAFLMGFYKILSSFAIIGMCAHAWSEYLDSIVDNQISQYLSKHLSNWSDISFLHDQPDFIAAGLIIILGLFACLTVRFSAKFCMLNTVIHLIATSIVVITFFSKADVDNWNLKYIAENTNNSSVSFMNPHENITINGNASNIEEITQLSNMTLHAIMKRSLDDEDSQTTEPTLIYSTELDVDFENLTYGNITDTTTVLPVTTSAYEEPTTESEPTIRGEGGFFPYGWSGIFQGTSLCLLAFQGWEVIVLSPEETKASEIGAPLAITICISVVCFVGVTLTSALTLLVPYWSLDSFAMLSTVLETSDLPWIKYVLLTALLSGLIATITAEIFTLTRVVYAMAMDGLLCGVCRRIGDLTRVPVFPTLVWTFFIALLTIFIDFHAFLRCVSLATLVGFLLVNMCVILLRYQPNEPSVLDVIGVQGGSSGASHERKRKQPKLEIRPGYENFCTDSESDDNVRETPGVVVVDKMSNLSKEQAGAIKPAFKDAQKYFITLITKSWVPIAVGSLLLLTVSIVLYVWLDNDGFLDLRWCVTVTLVGLVVAVIGTLISICMHQQAVRFVPFKIPLMPLIPYVSMLLCVVFIVAASDTHSWLSLTLVTATGLFFYCFYGLRHSKIGNLTTRFGDLEYSKLGDEDCSKLMDGFNEEN